MPDGVPSLRWRDLPGLLWQGCFFFLRDLHRYLLCGMLLFGLPVGLATFLSTAVFRSGWIAAGVAVIVGLAVAWWPAVLTTGVQLRASGGAPELADLIEAVTHHALALTGLAFIMAVVVALGFLGVFALATVITGMGLMAAVVGTILFVAFALHAFLAAVAVTERIHAWPAWRRCCALSQGRRWQTVCLIGTSGLLGYGLFRVWLELGPERIAPDIMAWLNIPVVVLLLALVAAIMGVLHQRLRQIEERGSARVLAAHFD